MSEESNVLEKKPETPTKLVSAGKPQPFKVNIPLGNQLQQNDNGGQAAAGEGAGTETPEQIAAKAKLIEDQSKGGASAGTGLTDEQKADNITKGLNEDGSPKSIELTKEVKEANIAKGLNEDGSPKERVLTDEEIKAEYEKRFPNQPDLTPEEIKKKEEAFEKRMLDLYVEQGGKLDQFALLKQVAATDLTELSKRALTEELKAQGFNETEIEAIQKERYYQIEQAEIDAIDDPEEKALAQKKFDYGNKKLQNKAAHIKENAVEFFNNLKEAVNHKDLLVKNESEFVSNVEAHFKEVPRKLTLEIGKVDNTDIPPVDYEVPEEVIAEAKDTLKDIKKRKQLLFNNDGTLNHKSIAELVLKAKMFDSAAKTSYLEGGNREVEKFEKIFPKNPNALGVGGNNQANTGKPGKIVKAGPPQRFRPAVNQ